MRLTTAARKALPDSAFAIPEKRAYPVQDRGHAVAAEGRVEQHGTPEEKARVLAKVRARFKGLAQKRKGGS